MVDIFCAISYYIFNGIKWDDLGFLGKNMMEKQEKQFRGSYNVKIDDRGRIKIPSRYLSILQSKYGNEVYLTSINGDCVLFYPLKVWVKIEDAIGKIKVRNQTLEKYAISTSYWGNETEIDRRGRVLVQPGLRDKSKLKDKVLILGNFDHMVIWNEEIFKLQYISKKFTEEKLNEVSLQINETSTLSNK